jgi:hypothetical protein
MSLIAVAIGPNSRPPCAYGATTVSRVEFRILGPLQVVEDGELLPLRGARERAVLAFLLLRAGEVVPRPATAGATAPPGLGAGSGNEDCRGTG